MSGDSGFFIRCLTLICLFFYQCWLKCGQAPRLPPLATSFAPSKLRLHKIIRDWPGPKSFDLIELENSLTMQYFMYYISLWAGKNAEHNPSKLLVNSPFGSSPSEFDAPFSLVEDGQVFLIHLPLLWRFCPSFHYSCFVVSQSILSFFCWSCLYVQPSVFPWLFGQGLYGVEGVTLLVLLALPEHEKLESRVQVALAGCNCFLAQLGVYFNCVYHWHCSCGVVGLVLAVAVSDSSFTHISLSSL